MCWSAPVSQRLGVIFAGPAFSNVNRLIDRALKRRRESHGLIDSEITRPFCPSRFPPRCSLLKPIHQLGQNFCHHGQCRKLSRVSATSAIRHFKQAVAFATICPLRWQIRHCAVFGRVSGRVLHRNVVESPRMIHRNRSIAESLLHIVWRPHRIDS